MQWWVVLNEEVRVVHEARIRRSSACPETKYSDMAS